MTKTIDDVRNFWESTPLFSGESRFPVGSLQFFQEHRTVYINDVLAGTLAAKYLPSTENRDAILDLGCGPGFWTIELARIATGQVEAADLTQTAVSLTLRRAAEFGFDNVSAQLQNAEELTYESGRFSHVNCQGVIHHTPRSEACVSEIARVLRPGGTACISVYYRNFALRAWPLLRFAGKVLAKLGAGLPGRGRERIYAVSDVDEIVRLYDGSENPIGKSYSRRQFEDMLRPHFEIEDMFPCFFPARSLPFKIPRALHRWLDRRMGFMILARVRRHPARAH